MTEKAGMGEAIWWVRAHDRDPILVDHPTDPSKQILVPHPEANLVYEVKHTNLIVRAARIDMMRHIIGSGTVINGGFIYLAVGSGVTAAAITDTALGTELTGNANRLTCTNTGGVDTISYTDISQSTVTGPPAYDQEVILQGVYLTTDSNNGSTFAEYGLFSSATNSDPTMWNHFLPASSIAKTSSISVTVQVLLRT